MKDDAFEFGNIDIFEIKKCLVVPIHMDLYDDFIIQLEKTILERLKSPSILGVVIDISAVKLIDSINLNNIINLCKMTKLMGKETVLIGFQAPVASALTEFPELELNKLKTFINLQSSIRYLRNQKKHNDKKKLIVENS